MKCRHCPTEIADNALICYRCGNPTTDPRVTPPADGPIFRQQGASTARTLILVILGLLALLLGLEVTDLIDLGLGL